MIYDKKQNKLKSKAEQDAEDFKMQKKNKIRTQVIGDSTFMKLIGLC